MVVSTITHEVNKAIDLNDIEEFKKLISTLDQLPYEVELKIINSHKLDFLQILFDDNKLSPKGKVLILSVLDKRLKQTLKLNSL